MRTALIAAATIALISPAFAQLEVGTVAPAISAKGATGTNEVSFDLAGALKDGPVVLFFYPKAFTPTCTIETEGFASKSADFKTAGAKLIGVSGDSIEDLKSFSSEKCGECVLLSDKDQTVMKAYDAVLQENPPISKRTTYVIAPDGKIIFALTDMKDGMAHVTGALDAVQKWKTSH